MTAFPKNARRSPDPILVVDDHSDSRDMLVEYLQFQNFTVHVAATGTAALALASTLRPRVILMDLMRDPNLAMAGKGEFRNPRFRRLTWTPRKDGDEQKFRERIGSRKPLPRPVVLDLQCWSVVTGKHQFEVIITRRHAVRRREPVVAVHRCGVQMRGDREGDGWSCRLANHEPAVGFHGFQDNVPHVVSRKLCTEGLDVTRDRRTEFIDESPTVQTDEVSLSSGHLLLPDTHRVPLSLVIRDPLDPVGDHHTSTHVNALGSHGEETPRAVRHSTLDGTSRTRTIRRFSRPIVPGEPLASRVDSAHD